MSDENLAGSFNSIADDYDAYRGGYPDEVVSDIIYISGVSNVSRALEIGCGTGQATKSFAKSGMSIVCVEPGLNLMKKAQANLASQDHVKFENSKFEDYDLNGHTYDLVYAAQSFHWVDKSRSYDMVHRALKPGALFAAFWKIGGPQSDPLSIALSEIYASYLPDYKKLSISEFEEDIFADLRKMLDSKKFRGCQLRRYKTADDVAEAEAYIKAVSTTSSIAILDPDRKQEMFSKFRNTILSHGGAVVSKTNEVMLVCGFAI